MLPPIELTQPAQNQLQQNGFTLTEAWNGGMHQNYNWTNGMLNFSLLYDRGYFDCTVGAVNQPGVSFPLIWLLRFIRNDKTFYETELKAANRWNTLEADQYVEVFCNSQKSIAVFFSTFHESVNSRFQAFGQEQ